MSNQSPSRAEQLRFARGIQPLAEAMGFGDCVITVTIRWKHGTRQEDGRRNVTVPRGVYSAVARDLGITRQAVQAAAERGDERTLALVSEKLNVWDAHRAAPDS